MPKRKLTQAQAFERLAELEAVILDAEEQAKKAQVEQDKAWKEANDLFDLLDGPDRPTRYLFTDGQVMGRIFAKHPQDGAIDVEALATEDKIIWDKVSTTRRVFDEEKAAASAESSEEVAAAIERCTIRKPPVLRRRWSKGTKEELAELKRENKVIDLPQPTLKRPRRKAAVA